MIRCNAVKCVWNKENQCTNQTVVIDRKEIYKFDELVDTVIICKSYSPKESAGHMDFSRFPKR